MGSDSNAISIERRRPTRRGSAQVLAASGVAPIALYARLMRVSCQVTEAAQPGIHAEQQKIYEAACSEGPGYILIEATPPDQVAVVFRDSSVRDS